MTTFRYKGQTAGGAKVSGVLRAYDEFEAADKLRESVAIITKLEAVPEKKESVLSRPVAFRVKEKELALLCSQFAIILASGLSVERCVSMVAAQTKNKYLRRMLDKVSEEVGAGYSLAQSFENNAPYLPRPLPRRCAPASSPARWRAASSVCMPTTTVPPRPGPRSSAP